MTLGKADLAKLMQHAHELVLVDDSPVGTLALEGDHSGHRLAGFGSRQICTQPQACSDRQTDTQTDTQTDSEYLMLQL